MANSIDGSTLSTRSYRLAAIVMRPIGNRLHRGILMIPSQRLRRLRDTGYKARIGSHELLLVSAAIKGLIHNRATVGENVESRAGAADDHAVARRCGQCSSRRHRLRSSKNRGNTLKAPVFPQPLGQTPSSFANAPHRCLTPAGRGAGSSDRDIFPARDKVCF